MATTFQIALAGAGMAAGTFKGLIEDVVADAGEALTLEALINLGAAEPLTDAQWATKLVSNTIGGAAAANDEQAFIDAIAELAQQFSRGDLMVAYINLLDAVSVDDPVWGAAIQQWNNRLAVSEALDAALAAEANTNAGDVALLQGLMAGVTANPATLNAALADVADAWIGGVNPNPTPVDPGTEGATIRLNLTESVYEGTANDDTFIAMPLGNTDTFMSGVMVDGGAGRDTLDITLGNFSNFAILAETTGVEVVSVRSQAVNRNGNNGDNEVGDSNIISGARNVIDAELMEGVQEWWSSNSRSDLIVEDVRSNSHQTTVGFRNADAGDVDYAVYFDNQFITAADPSAAGATLFLRLLDLDGMRTDGEPLLNNPYNGFSFMLDGVRKVLQSDGILEATTFAELRDAINAALADDPSLADLQASLGMDYTAINSDTGVSYVGTEIVIANSGSGVLATGSWLTPTGEAPADTNILARQSNEQPDVIEPLTSVNIVLDNVGRGSKSGDLEIGAMSQSDYSGSRGIEQFDIEVDRSSWIDTLQSTNNTLEVVNVENIGANGNLRIDQLQDVRVFNAEAMQGDVVLTADLSGFVTTKYLDRTDDQNNPAADNVAFNYSTGSGHDAIDLTISAANLAWAGTTNREDFDLNISSGAGNDEIILTIVDDFGNPASDGAIGTSPFLANWYDNSQLNANLQINAGEGDDVVRTPGSGDVIINLGAGNDVVYTDNTGGQGVYVFNTATKAPVHTNLFNAQSDVNDAYRISGGELTVSFLGFQAVVDLPTDAGHEVTDLHVNQAIKNAINNSPVLSALLVAEDGPANTLFVTSLIDGVRTTADLSVTLSAPAELTPNQVAQLNTAWGLTGQTADQLIALMNAQIAAFNTKGDYATTFATNGFANLTGTNSIHTSDNTITPGTGNDVVVLGTGMQSNETVVYEGFGNGTDSIVNFGVGVVNASDAVTELRYMVNTLTSFTVSIADITPNPAPATVTLAFNGGAPINIDNAGGQSLIPGEDVAYNFFMNLVGGLYTDGDGTEWTVTYADGVLTFTNNNNAIIDPTEIDGTDFVFADVTAGGGATVTKTEGEVQGSAPVAATVETFTVDFNGSVAVTAGNHISFDGVNVAVAIGDGPIELAAKVLAANFPNWTVESTGNGILQFTANTAGAQPDATSADFGQPAAVAEEFTVDFTGSSIDAGDTVSFDGVATAALLAGATPQDIVDALELLTFPNWTIVDNNDGTATFTAVTPGVVTPDVVDGDFALVGTGTLASAVAVDVQGEDAVVFTPAVAEEFTVDFTGSTIDAGDTVSFDGVTTAALGAGATPQDIVDALELLTFTNWTIFDNNDGTATFTAVTPGDTSDVAPGDFTLTGTGALASAVTVDVQGADAVGAGIQAVVTITSDGADAIDAVGELTEVVVTPAQPGGENPGIDMLDFSAYDVTGVEVGTMVGDTFISDEAFHGAWVEGDEYVFLVESAENAGEYQMLHVEATGASTYQTLGIIGTADFGQSMNFVEENFII